MVRGEERSALSGAIVDRAGAPQAGVPVTLFRGQTLVDEQRTGDQGAFCFERLPLGVYMVVVPQITVAGIALDGVASRTLKLTQAATGGLRYVPTRQRLLPEEETGGRRVLYGIVSDASGAGLNGVKVRMSWSDASPDTEFPVEVTGRKTDRPAGYYEFVTTAGVFALTVVQGDWPSDEASGLETAHVPGRAGMPISYEVDFQLRPGARLCREEWVAPGALPGSGVTLTGSDGRRMAALDAGSAFAFADLPPGSYALELEGIGVIASAIVLDPGRLYKQLFPLQSQMTGQVDGAAAGAIAVLHAPPAWGWTRQSPLDAAGRFAFSGLPAGCYRLTIPGADPAEVELTGENRLELPRLDLRAGQRGVLRGRVINPARQPIEGVELILAHDGVTLVTTCTDAEGAYRFANLPAGIYTLSAVGMGEVLRDLALDGEREVLVDVTWLLGTIVGRVLSAGGLPLGGRAVLLLRDAATIARTETSADGAFRFGALAPGVYALALADGIPVASGLEVAEGGIVRCDLTLPASKPVAHYLLFPEPDRQAEAGAVMARLALALAWRYLRQTGATGGFSVDEASQAECVTVVGRSLAPEADAALRAAGCRVTCLPEDAAALAAALEALTAAAGEG